MIEPQIGEVPGITCSSNTAESEVLRSCLAWRFPHERERRVEPHDQSWVTSLAELAQLSAALIDDRSTISSAENALVDGHEAPDVELVGQTRQEIEGADPLGTQYCRIHSRDDRRPLGQTYTPGPIEAMINWARAKGAPERIIDPRIGLRSVPARCGRGVPGRAGGRCRGRPAVSAHGPRPTSPSEVWATGPQFMSATTETWSSPELGLNAVHRQSAVRETPPD